MFTLDASVGDSVDDAEAEVLNSELQINVENLNHSGNHLYHLLWHAAATALTAVAGRNSSLDLKWLIFF